MENKRVLTDPRSSQESLLTELTNSKAKLEEDRIKTQAMLNSLGEGLIATDVNGRITTINPYALRSLGYTEDELVGAWFPKAIIAVDEQSRRIPQLERPILQALTTGQTVSRRAHYLRKNGTTMPVFITVSPVLNRDRPIGAIEVFRDLTNETQLDIAKDEFVSLASHQLRTPATGVKLILSMLAKGDFGELTVTQQRYLEKAIQSNERQLRIIENLLNVAQVDSGKMKLQHEMADLVAILREAAGEHTALMLDRHQEIHLTVPSELKLFIDAAKIRMVIDNLMSNASKYSNPGEKIMIGLRRDPGHAIISITDRGVGMTKDDLAKIFTKFTRLKNELSASAGGTGLGLFLAKNIVELHGGSISALSREGQGSTFTIKLPLKQGAIMP